MQWRTRPGQAGRAGLGLLALLTVTVLFVLGTVLLKYKLAVLRAAIESQAETRGGIQVTMGSVGLNWFRGVRVTEVEARVVSVDGPALEAHADEAVVDLDLGSLFYGEITIDRIQMDRAKVLIARPPDRKWFAEGIFPTSAPGSGRALPFRLTGAHASLDVRNVVGDTVLPFNEVAFDIARLPDSTDVVAKLAGNLHRDPAKNLHINLRFTTMEDFDLRLQCGQITEEDINVFLPAPQRFIEKAAASPSIRIAGYPKRRLVIAAEAPFESLIVRDQPDFIRPSPGMIIALASYDMGAHVLTLEAAKAASRDLSGSIEGSVSFARNLPSFDLTFEADSLPALDILHAAMGDQFEQVEGVDILLEEPYTAWLRLEGTSEQPLISGWMNVAGGQVTLDPSDPGMPRGVLDLSPIQIAWGAEDTPPEATFRITGGQLQADTWGVSADHISASVNISEGQLCCDPINAFVTGNPMVGRLSYAFSSDTLDVNLNGQISTLEQFGWTKTDSGFSMSGSVGFRCHAVRAGEGVLVAEGEFDATQTDITYGWLFHKPAGTGATGKLFQVDYTPGKTLAFRGELLAASTPVHAEGVLDWRDGHWDWQKVRLDSNQVDIDALGRCFPVNYTLNGGTGTGAFLEWTRPETAGKASVLHIGGQLDEIACLPAGGAIPIHCHDVTIDTRIAMDPTTASSFEVHAEDGSMPPFGALWTVPLNPTETASQPSRAWEYRLSADKLDAAPWKGQHFLGLVYTRPEASGMTSFSADVDGGGQINGRYQVTRPDHVFDMDVEWKDIPAAYLMAHFKYPGVMTGTATGRFHYKVDKEDPGTLEGEGQFDIRDGQFSADFLLAQFERQFREQSAVLPPSLRFNRLSAEVVLRGDKVETPKFRLEAEGLTLDANGGFIRDGDITYTLRLSLTPDLAQQIPALRENINLQGARLAQQNIELTFRITGPLFNPQGELADAPPVGVTLVSGALEVTSEAVGLIDLPRRILVDLLKTGGGLVLRNR